MDTLFDLDELNQSVAYTPASLKESDRVEFFPFGHKYLLDGKVFLMGVTSLMKKHGLSPDYSGISQEVLDHAADLGTQAHEMIEAYVEGRVAQEIPLITSFRKLGLNICRTEFLVTDEETVASSIDLLNAEGGNQFSIIDMKRTSTVHKDALRWQLGIYKHLFLRANPWAEVVGCYCLPIKKGNKDNILADVCGPLVEIQPVSDKEVEALLKAEREGTIYSPETKEVAIDEMNLSVITSQLKKIAETEAVLKQLNEALDQTKAAIQQEMLDRGLDKYETDDVKITLRRETTQTRFDSAAFKEADPETYAKYTKVTPVKGSITIKLK